MQRPPNSIWLFFIPAALTALIYLPGINGTFHFDDLPNLSVLGNYGAVDSWATFNAYIKSAVASDIGRPLAMSTFLFNAQSWPAPAQPFLITNVSIHTANVMLAALVFHTLLKNTKNLFLSSRSLPIAIVGATLWAAHPFLTSTVLYIVQRMALLAAFFGLCAFLIYLQARIKLIEQQGLTPLQIAIYTIAIGAFTLAGVLCKENAALIPLLILIIEFFGIRPLWFDVDYQRKKLNIWLLVFLGGPTLYVIYRILMNMLATGLYDPISVRPFTGIERLLAQPQILFYYLYCLIFPQPSYPGLFYDGHPLALADPKQILAWIPLFALTGLTAIAVFIRRFWPLSSLAFIFFLGGHAIESLIPGLEPIFEHRNYFPSLFIFLAVSAALFSIPFAVIRNLAISGTTALLLFFTLSHASLWGNPLNLKLMWANSNFWSERAQVSAAKALLDENRARLALQLLRNAAADMPESPSILFSLFVLERKLGLNATGTGATALSSLATSPYNLQYPELSTLVIEEYLQNGEKVIPLGFIDRMLEAFLTREEYQERISQTIVRGNRLTISLKEKRHESACRDAIWLLEHLPQAGTAINFAAKFAQYGYLEEGLRLLAIAGRRLALDAHRHVMPRDWYEREIDRLRALMQEDMANTDITTTALCNFSSIRGADNR